MGQDLLDKGKTVKKPKTSISGKPLLQSINKLIRLNVNQLSVLRSLYRELLTCLRFIKVLLSHGFSLRKSSDTNHKECYL